MSLRVSSKPPKDRLESQQDPTKIVVSLTRSTFGGFKKKLALMVLHDPQSR